MSRLVVPTVHHSSYLRRFSLRSSAEGEEVRRWTVWTDEPTRRTVDGESERETDERLDQDMRKDDEEPRAAREWGSRSISPVNRSSTSHFCHSCRSPLSYVRRVLATFIPSVRRMRGDRASGGRMGIWGEKPTRRKEECWAAYASFRSSLPSAPPLGRSSLTLRGRWWEERKGVKWNVKFFSHLFVFIIFFILYLLIFFLLSSCLNNNLFSYFLLFFSYFFHVFHHFQFQ